VKISRELNLFINYILNEIIPPILRDSRLFRPLFRLFFGKKYHLFWDFRKNVYKMTDEEFRQINIEISDLIIRRDTDLNKRCVEEILKEVKNKNVLEVGCGSGYLAKKLSKNNKVTAVDINIGKELKNLESETLSLFEASAEILPFADKVFDVVICTHTLENVRYISKALSELRRLARSKLIIVFPKERPYLFCPNLHIHFFPYEFSVFAVMGVFKNQELKNIGGDWYYKENYNLIQKDEHL